MPYSAATVSVTSARWVWRTASGSSRVVPEVYWNTARSSARVVVSNAAGKSCRRAMKRSSNTTVVVSWIDWDSSAFSALVTSRRGLQSLTRNRTPSGPKRVNSGTAMAPLLMTPNIAV